MAQVSVFRLRLGVVLIGIFGSRSGCSLRCCPPLDQPVASVTIAIALVQTIIGVIGVLLAGRQTLALVRHTGWRAVPGKIWHIVWTGKVDEPEPTAEAAPASD
jgi:hypothetical protein